MDFGSVVSLIGLMRGKQRNGIANNFGVHNGWTFFEWMKTLNYLRNLAAHHGRVWNRTLTIRLKMISEHKAAPELAHAISDFKNAKIYGHLAVTASLISRIDPTSEWHLHVRELVLAFPRIEGMSPQTDMGFPDFWESFLLWSRIPALM